MGYVFSHLGWRAILAIAASTATYVLIFRKELVALARLPEREDIDVPEEDVQTFGPLPLPACLITLHLAFLAWTVGTAHYPALFIGGFLIFLGVSKATAAYQTRIDLKAPLLVGFFLAGLVIHGGLQGWWIAPLLERLGQEPLFGASALLTAFNDNALITYLATLVPNFSEPFKIAVVQGAVAGGGLTVIANAPNPAGQALLSRFFDGAVSPARLFLAALVPTLIAAICFRVI
jgi:hypothetical protein